MNHLIKLQLFIVLLFSLQAFSQDGRVLITEKKKGKRIVLMAENTTKDTLNVFLMVDAEGYRRSASQPQLQNLPPLSKTPLITLIELTDVPSHYSYELIINEKEQPRINTYGKETIDIEKTISGKLVLFSEKDCDKCALLDNMLTADRIQFRNFDIGEDAVLYEQFIKFIRKRFPNKTEIRLPVIWNKDHVIFGYDNLEELLNELRSMN